jgi:beta-glucosidase
MISRSFNTLKNISVRGDEKKLVFDFDYIGIQYYDRMIARSSLLPPFVFAREMPAEELNAAGHHMGHGYYPQGIREVVERYWSYPRIPRLIISECGISVEDQVEQGRINDPKRLEYHQQVISEVRNMINEGIPIDGYFVRSLTDTLHASTTRNPGFGLVYIDARTSEPVIKNSGYWFQDFLA